MEGFNRVWQDDLILTNVRSFDIKAYDPDSSLYNAPAEGGAPQGEAAQPAGGDVVDAEYTVNK